ncbi:unnamed protein product [Camellia sinensis]
MYDIFDNWKGDEKSTGLLFNIPQVVAELASSPKFTDWIIKHADRIQLLPDDSSDNTIGYGLDSTDENLVESGDRFSLFKW